MCIRDSRGFGIAGWAPAWLLVVPAVVALVVARPRGWALFAAPLAAGWATATWVALTMHGFWWPGRQLVVVLPLALLVVLWWLARLRPPVRLLAGGLAAVLAASGVLTYGWVLRAGLAGEITWVIGFETVSAPVYQALRPLLPDYRGSDFLALHLAWAVIICGLGLAGAWSVRGRGLR